MTDTNSDKLNTLKGLVEQNIVKPQVAETYPLDQVREAFQKLEARGVSGKVIIEIKS